MVRQYRRDCGQVLGSIVCYVYGSYLYSKKVADSLFWTRHESTLFDWTIDETLVDRIVRSTSNEAERSCH